MKFHTNFFTKSHLFVPIKRKYFSTDNDRLQQNVFWIATLKQSCGKIDLHAWMMIIYLDSRLLITVFSSKDELLNNITSFNYSALLKHFEGSGKDGSLVPRRILLQCFRYGGKTKVHIDLNSSYLFPWENRMKYFTKIRFILIM